MQEPQLFFKTWAKTDFKVYSAAVMAGKKPYFYATVVSVQCRPPKLFYVVRGLLRSCLQEEGVQWPTMTILFNPSQIKSLTSILTWGLH